MNKILLIIPYFGKFNNYFSLFIDFLKTVLPAIHGRCCQHEWQAKYLPCIEGAKINKIV